MFALQWLSKIAEPNSVTTIQYARIQMNLKYIIFHDSKLNQL